MTINKFSLICFEEEACELWFCFLASSYPSILPTSQICRYRHIEDEFTSPCLPELQKCLNDEDYRWDAMIFFTIISNTWYWWETLYYYSFVNYYFLWAKLYTNFLEVQRRPLATSSLGLVVWHKDRGRLKKI